MTPIRVRVILPHDTNRAAVHAWLRDNNGATNRQLAAALHQVRLVYDSPALRALVLDWVHEIAAPEATPLTPATRWWLREAS